MAGDLPQITTGNYMHSTYGGDFVAGGLAGQGVRLGDDPLEMIRSAIRPWEAREPKQQFEIIQEKVQEIIMSQQKRLVQVFIADPDARVPVEDSLLDKTEQKMTDLTDQELFFEMNIKEALDKHNAKRIGIPDKQASQRAGKDVFLEPIKIRDLKMTVVAIATF